MPDWILKVTIEYVKTVKIRVPTCWEQKST